MTAVSLLFLTTYRLVIAENDAYSEISCSEYQPRSLSYVELMESKINRVML